MNGGYFLWACGWLLLFRGGCWAQWKCACQEGQHGPDPQILWHNLAHFCRTKICHSQLRLVLKFPLPPVGQASASVRAHKTAASYAVVPRPRRFGRSSPLHLLRGMKHSACRFRITKFDTSVGCVSGGRHAAVPGTCLVRHGGGGRTRTEEPLPRTTIQPHHGQRLSAVGFCPQSKSGLMDTAEPGETTPNYPFQSAGLCSCSVSPGVPLGGQC